MAPLHPLEEIELEMPAQYSAAAARMYLESRDGMAVHHVAVQYVNAQYFRVKLYLGGVRPVVYVT